MKSIFLLLWRLMERVNSTSDLLERNPPPHARVYFTVVGKRMDLLQRGPRKRDESCGLSIYLVREPGSSSSEGNRDWQIPPERLRRFGKHAYLLNPKELGFERLRSLELKFISLVGLVNREKERLGFGVCRGWWCWWQQSGLVLRNEANSS